MVGHVCSSSLGGIEFAERRGVFSDPRATMTNFLLSHRDCVILTAGAVLVFAVLHRWLWRERTKGVVVPVMWVIVLTVPGAVGFSSRARPSGSETGCGRWWKATHLLTRRSWRRRSAD